MEFVFQITVYDAEVLAPQVSQALEKRTELISRGRYPDMWKRIDKLNGGKASEQILKKQRVRNRMYGIFLLVMGLLLMIPGLMESKKLLVPLFVGACATGIGMCKLWCSRKEKITRFDYAAKKLLSGLQAGSPVTVCFTVDGMRIEGKEIVPFCNFEYVIEMQDLFLCTWDNQVTVLQKKDMVVGQETNFCHFIEKQINDSAKIYFLSGSLGI